MPNLKDIAGRLGISVSSVSRALNNRPGLSEELVRQIKRTARELHYHPDAAARALKSRTTHVIGLVIPDILNPFFPALVKSVEKAAQSFGHLMVLYHSEGKARTEERFVRLLLEKKVDGLLVAPTGGSLKILDELISAHHPIVLLDRQPPASRALSVTVDNYGGAKAATEHLLKQGCWPIFHIRGPLSASTAAERLEGFRSALNEAGKGFDKQLILAGDFTIEAGRRAGEVLKARISGKPGIFASNDLMALGAIYALGEENLFAPEHFLIVGFDDIAMSRISRPPLSSVAQPVFEMGQVGVRMLLQMIRGEHFEKSVTLPCRLVIRQSSSPECSSARVISSHVSARELLG